MKEYAATEATALALYIALTYANQRRQFDSGAGTDEVVLLDYGKHQRRLLPLLAQNYAQFFANDELLRKFDGVFSGRTDTPQEREDLETLAAALKPLSTWNALSTIQEAREACGGSGFLAENRMVGLHQDLDVLLVAHECLEALRDDVVQRDSLRDEILGLEEALLHEQHDGREDVAISDDAPHDPFLQDDRVGLEGGLLLPDRDELLVHE